NIIKTYGDSIVLDDISFDVSHGEFCVILGPSGCGKSTILRTIAGLEYQDSGTIVIGDNEMSGLSPKERDVAMVFQSYALYPHMNVYENMAFSLKMKKIPRKEIDKKVREAARLLEIDELLLRKPKELSGGQRQRVAIGRAIVRNPKLFLFDEPLSNLDAKLRASMRLELAGLHRKLGCTIIYVTHDQTEAMTLGQKIVLMKEGRIQQIGSPDELYKRPANLFVAAFIGSPQINLVEGSLVHVDGSLCFRSDAFIIDISRMEELKKYEGRNVVLGIRPEAVLTGRGPINGVVEFVENLGSETILYIRVDEIRLTARALSEISGGSGDEITLSLSDKGMNLFFEGERIA
ncbi:MAG: ABC transporter ATP-binding protein, partial [Thermodesulfovibrionales bacterium]